MFSAADKSLQLPSNRKVDKDVVAIMWHVKHDKLVSPLSIDDDRIDQFSDNVHFINWPKLKSPVIELYRQRIEYSHGLIQLQHTKVTNINDIDSIYDALVTNVTKVTREIIPPKKIRRHLNPTGINIYLN
ncbi:hypothetical protein ACF0H5_009314 [Mactra antiquata]